MELLLKLLNYKHKRYMGTNGLSSAYFPDISNSVAKVNTRACKPYFRVLLCGNDVVPHSYETGLFGAYIRLKRHLRKMNCPR